MVDGTFEMTGGTIQNNKVQYYGGVYVQHSHTGSGHDDECIELSGTVTGNTAMLGGGAYITDAGTVAIKGTVTGNYATVDGGGIYLYGCTTVTITSAEIKNNGVNGASSAYTVSGGGLYLIDCSTVTISGTTIESNYATETGAGVNVSTTEKLLITGVAITGNKYATHGAGIYLYEVEEAYLSGVNITNNGQVSDISLQNIRYGAGIYAIDGNVSIYGSSTISGNTASTSGGGVYLYDGTLTMSANNDNSATITGNYAAQGAGVYLLVSELDMSAGKIYENYAETEKTTELGIYVLDGTFTMSDGYLGGSIEGYGTILLTGGFFDEAAYESAKDSDYFEEDKGFVDASGATGYDAAFPYTIGAVTSSGSGSESSNTHTHTYTWRRNSSSHVSVCKREPSAKCRRLRLLAQYDIKICAAQMNCSECANHKRRAYPCVILTKRPKGARGEISPTGITPLVNV